MRTGLSRVVVPRQHRCKMNHNRISPSRLPSDRQPCSCLVNNMCFIYIYIYIYIYLFLANTSNTSKAYTLQYFLSYRRVWPRAVTSTEYFGFSDAKGPLQDATKVIASLLYIKNGGRGGEGEKKTSIFRKFHSRLPESRLPKKN